MADNTTLMTYNNEHVYGVIYCFTNKINGKKYVGQTTDLLTRLSKYRNLLCKGQPKFYNALVKYGFDGFIFEVIYVAYDKEQLDFLESWFIEEYNTMSNGYNLRSGGSSNSKMSSETKQKMSLFWTGKKRNKMSQSTKDKISLSKKGKKRKPHTDEEKRKISLGCKGKKLTKEQCLNKLGSKNPFAKSVLCITTGKVYGSLMDASIDTNSSRSGISNNITGRCNSAGKLSDGTKFVWKYIKEVK
jgi:group I intron endonuclease